MIVFFLLYAVLALLCVAGYLTNLVWVFHHLTTAITVETVLALIGLFTPLGPLHGFYLWL